jgi:MYXO-CTERM domain-containing protein
LARGQPPLSNGSFETGDFGGWTLLNTQPSPNSAVVTTNVFDGIGIIEPEDGKFEAAFEGVGGPEISQTFSDMAGEELEVSVWYAFTDTDPDLNMSIAGTLHVLPFVSTGVYQEFHFDFKATGSDTLQINSVAGSGFEAVNVVDNLSVESVVGVPETPEASTWTMMLLGLVALGVAGPRRRRFGSQARLACSARPTVQSSARN